MGRKYEFFISEKYMAVSEKLGESLQQSKSSMLCGT